MTGSIKDLLLFRWAALGLLALLSCLLTVVLYRGFKRGRVRVTLDGRLVLVVGPSGSGKDTLIHGARRLLADRPGFVFPQREITRVRDDRAEAFVSLTPEEFDARERAGLTP
ncbi:hypothetical protein [Phenylobacterium sp.]|jgi:hypothetical protein|uniref:hypothetical protein n=1 Tax=Phenylobacterium sp. TaxID=1871053 RepID=UPI002E35160B|nr:hypothetical protein [Phenylobacterium sp.]HEX3364991.1 hypothetical protein [Phenylobacterium sp.]